MTLEESMVDFTKLILFFKTDLFEREKERERAGVGTEKEGDKQTPR